MNPTLEQLSGAICELEAEIQYRYRDIVACKRCFRVSDTVETCSVCGYQRCKECANQADQECLFCEEWVCGKEECQVCLQSKIKDYYLAIILANVKIEKYVVTTTQSITMNIAIRRSIPMMGRRSFSSSAGNDLELVKLSHKHRLDMVQSIGSTVCYLGFFGTIAGLAWINQTQVKVPHTNTPLKVTQKV